MIVGRRMERWAALVTAIAVPAVLRLRPLPVVLAFCDGIPVRAARPQPPRMLARRVQRWLGYGHGPWKSTCLTRSLVLYAMLRQHGHTPRFAVGVLGSEQSFEAHAWVSIEGVPVIDSPLVETGFAQVMSHVA
jgi:hypothetical protein